jgi:hypothetical protein
MKSSPLPPELLELEERLRARFNAEPSADLRFGIIQSVDRNVSVQTPSSRQNGDGWYWAAIAAAGIIALNLSVIDSTRTEFSRGAGISQMVNVEPLQEVPSLKPGAFN